MSSTKIDKREDVNPEEGERRYGDVKFADPVNNKYPIDTLLEERLKLRVQAELAAGYALLGTHRDDLDILFDGHDLRKFGSSGQQRSALLILQLANLSVYYSQHNEYPLFLLDDIDAELDYKRIGQLLEYLSDKTQTFVTTSKESFIEKFGTAAEIFTVSGGKAESNREGLETAA